MDTQQCIDQAKLYQEAMDRWLANVDKLREFTAFPVEDPTGLRPPRDLYWVTLVLTARGMEAESHDRFLDAMDRYVNCIVEAHCQEEPKAG